MTLFASSTEKFLIRLSRKFDYTDKKVLSSFPLPVAVCGKDGAVSWCSERFINEIAGGEITESILNAVSTGVVTQALVPNENGNGMELSKTVYDAAGHGNSVAYISAVQ